VTTLAERPGPAAPAWPAATPAARLTPPAAGRLPSRRTPRRLPTRALDLVLAVSLGLLVIATHGARLSAGPGYGDDEGTYVAQAWALLHQGTLAHYTYWYDHPPLGWMVMAAWNGTAGHLFSPATAVEGGRQFMVVVAAATALLLYVLCRRIGLHRWAAALAVVAWALSPLALSYSRMVYLDNIGVAFVLAALVCAYSPRRHLWAYASAGLLLAAGVLTKETLLLSAPAVVYAVYARSAGKTRPFCVAAFAATALLVVGLYPLFATLKGELLPGPGHVSLLDALRFQLASRTSTGSPLSPDSGSAALVGRWLHTDPYLLGAGVLLAPVAVAVRRLRGAGLALLVPVAAALRPGYLPDPFVIALLPFCAVVAAGLLDVAVTAVGGRVGTRLAGVSRGERRPSRRHLGGSLVLPAVVAAANGRWRRLSRPRRLVPGLVAGILAAVAVGGIATVVGPPWTSSARALQADQGTTRILAAENWVAANVPHDARVLVDDTMWVDLVSRGFNPHLGVIWFYKIDFTNNLDPSVARSLPNGYRDVQYVVETPVLRAALAQLPAGLADLRLALRNSVPLTVIGSGDERIEVRKITPPPLP